MRFFIDADFEEIFSGQECKQIEEGLIEDDEDDEELLVETNDSYSQGSSAYDDTWYTDKVKEVLANECGITCNDSPFQQAHEGGLIRFGMDCYDSYNTRHLHMENWQKDDCTNCSCSVSGRVLVHIVDVTVVLLTARCKCFKATER